MTALLSRGRDGRLSRSKGKKETASGAGTRLATLGTEMDATPLARGWTQGRPRAEGFSRRHSLPICAETLCETGVAAAAPGRRTRHVSVMASMLRIGNTIESGTSPSRRTSATASAPRTASRRPGRSGHRVRVHQVHLFIKHSVQHAGEYGATQQARAQLGRLACIDDANAPEHSAAPGGDLRR